MIYPRGSKFGVAVYDPATRGMRWVGTYDSRSEAESAESLEKERGESLDSFSRRWLTLRPRQSQNSEGKMQQRIQPFVARFGELRLRDIGTPEAQADIRTWASAQPDNVFEVSRVFVNDAIRCGLYQGRNPLADPSKSEIASIASLGRAAHAPGGGGDRRSW
jgi:hypothetical protein